MNEVVRAIETSYKGFAFRSRLEARWAVYFDAIGLDWDYEREGFKLASGWYLPDFWLPQVSLWAEVKPVELSAIEMRKVQELVVGTGKGCILLVGRPECKEYTLVEPAYSPDMDMGNGVFNNDCVLSMYHNYPKDDGRFYTATGGTQERDFLTGGMFDDVEQAVHASRSARF